MKSRNKVTLWLLSLGAFTAILNTGAYFLLPGEIHTGIFPGGKTVNTLLYLALSAVLTALSGAAGICIQEKSKKYLFLTGALSVLNLACLAVNLL